MVIGGLQRGGRERRLLELIKGLTKEGYEVYVISLSSVVEYPYVYDLPITFQIMEGDKMTRINGIRKVIRTFQPDIIHSWDITCSGYLALSNLFINKPVVQGVIYDASSSSSLGKSIRNRIRLVAPLSKAFVANSMAGIEAYQPPASKSVCIYNGIDLNRFNNLKQPEATAQEILGTAKGNRFIVAMIAAFQIRKDYNTFLDVAVTMCRRDKNMTFLLIGEGEFRKDIESKTPADLAGTQIFFTGMRQDIESIIQIIDAGVLLTNSENHSEGISNTIVE
jgi:glycosyltransferase involved in cell wall biosynthesis